MVNYQIARLELLVIPTDVQSVKSVLTLSDCIDMKQVHLQVKFVYYVTYLVMLIYTSFTIGASQNAHLCFNHIQPYLSYALPSKLILIHILSYQITWSYRPHIRGQKKMALTNRRIKI